MKGATPKLDFAPYDVGMVILDVGLAMATKGHACQAGDTPCGHIKVNALFCITRTQCCNKMASIALVVGGARVNALAFSGSNFLFSMLRDPGAGEERKRHDQAVDMEQLQAAQVKWSRKRSERLDWINENLRRQGHAVHTFRNVDEAIRQYNLVSGSDAQTLEQMEPKPKLSDFYLPSPDQRGREIAFVVMGLGVTTFVAYMLTK